MGDRIQSLRSFVAELRRRKVVRVAVVYGIVGFAVIEAADIMVPALSLPSEFVTAVVVAVLLGYPIAIVLAWSYDVVPDAVVKQAEVARGLDGTADASVKPTSTAFRVVVSLGVAALAITAWLQYRASLPTEPVSARYLDSVAVMPFDNLTGDPTFDHIGVGITEEISTHLTRIPPLKVSSRHSVQAISARNFTAPQIANALDVRHVIEGSVRIGTDG